MDRLKLMVFIIVLTIGCKDKEQASREDGSRVEHGEMEQVDTNLNTQEKKYDSILSKLHLSEERNLNDYEGNLALFKSIKSDLDNMPVALIESIFPLSQAEYSRFYKMSYPSEYKESDQEMFDLAYNTMTKGFKSNKGKCRTLYLELSPYVDGEFAESYFLNIDEMIRISHMEFCELFSELNDASKERLRFYFEDYCE